MTTPKLHRSLIRHLDLFQALSDPELDKALENAQTHRLLTGDFAFRQGEAASRFFVLLHGHLKVVQTNTEGEQVIVRYVSPGDIFGIAKAMRRPDYPASVIAVQESIALSWPSSEWERLLSSNMAFGASALQTVGQRLQDAHTRIQELSTEEVEQRVARALLRLIETSGNRTPEGIIIDFPITRQDIAEMTGTTLHTVSRLLSAWKERGLVQSRRMRIMVCDTDELVRLSDKAAPPPADATPPGGA